MSSFLGTSFQLQVLIEWLSPFHRDSLVHPENLATRHLPGADPPPKAK